MFTRVIFTACLIICLCWWSVGNVDGFQIPNIAQATSFSRMASRFVRPRATSKLKQVVKAVKNPTNVLSVGEDTFVASFMNDQVLKIDLVEKTTSVFASGSFCVLDSSDCAILNGPWGLAEKGGILYVSSFGSDQILKFSIKEGNFCGTLGASDTLDSPEGIKFGPDGLLYVVNYLRNDVVTFNTTTGQHRVFARSEFLDGPEDLEFDSHGNMLVTSYRNNTVVRFGRDGRMKSVIGGGEQIDGPVGVVLGPDHHIYVASYRQNRVVRFHGWTGEYMGLYASGKRLRGPSGVCFGDDGRLYVASYENNKLFLFDRGSKVIKIM